VARFPLPAFKLVDQTIEQPIEGASALLPKPFAQGPVAFCRGHLHVKGDQKDPAPDAVVGSRTVRLMVAGHSPLKEGMHLNEIGMKLAHEYGRAARQFFDNAHL